MLNVISPRVWYVPLMEPVYILMVKIALIIINVRAAYAILLVQELELALQNILAEAYVLLIIVRPVSHVWTESVNRSAPQVCLWFPESAAPSAPFLTIATQVHLTNLSVTLD
jgi:hypothetical protein